MRPAPRAKLANALKMSATSTASRPPLSRCHSSSRRAADGAAWLSGSKTRSRSIAALSARTASSPEAGRVAFGTAWSHNASGVPCGHAVPLEEIQFFSSRVGREPTVHADSGSLVGRPTTPRGHA